VQDIRQIGKQAIEYRVDWRLFTEMVVIVEHEDELLVDPFQHLIQQNINGAFRMLS